MGKHDSIDWFCWLRFDSPSIFAALLDADDGALPGSAGRGLHGGVAVSPRHKGAGDNLYDVLGCQVAALHNGPLPAQEIRRLRLDVSTTGFTSETYFLRVRGEDFAATKQVTVVQ